MLFNMKRAEEEIVRLNIEIRRLLTFMFDEHVEYYHAIARHITIDPAFAHELSARWVYRNRIHTKISARLQQVARLPRFTGTLSSGRRLGHAAQRGLDVPLPSWAAYNTSADTDETEDTEKTEDPDEVAVAGEPIDVGEEDSLRVESLSAQDSDAFVSFIDDLGVRERDM